MSNVNQVVEVSNVSESPRIYAACLASYNNGTLHGRWIDCDQGADHIRDEIAAMLAESKQPGAEEWAAHDHENWGGWNPGENPDPDELAAVAEAIAEHGEVFGKLMEHGVASDAQEAIAYMEENYQGAWADLETWAENFLDDTGGLNGMAENLRCYFDYEKYARDCELGGDVFTVDTSDGMTHVFWNR